MDEDITPYHTKHLNISMIKELDNMLEEYSKTGVETEKEIGSFHNQYFCKILSVRVKLEKRIPAVSGFDIQTVDYTDWEDGKERE